jgi:chorismate-pyruvate lyase
MRSLETLSTAEALHPWLRLTTSLTQKLQHSFATKPGLSLLGEGLEQGNAWERELLSAQQNVYARHIALTIEGTPIVLARSVTTQGSGMHALTRLKTRPLAELLFEDSQWERNANMQYLALDGGVPGRGCLWHNRALGAGLIVQEFFLHALLAKVGP